METFTGKEIRIREGTWTKGSCHQQTPPALPPGRPNAAHQRSLEADTGVTAAEIVAAGKAAAQDGWEPVRKLLAAVVWLLARLGEGALALEEAMGGSRTQLANRLPAAPSGESDETVSHNHAVRPRRNLVLGSGDAAVGRVVGQPEADARAEVVSLGRRQQQRRGV